MHNFCLKKDQDNLPLNYNKMVNKNFTLLIVIKIKQLGFRINRIKIIIALRYYNYTNIM